MTDIYPSDSQIASKVLEINPDGRLAGAAITNIRDLIKWACDWQAARDADICDKRVQKRFEEFGVVEPDTNAGYYDSQHEWCQTADEEAEEIASAIRSGRE